MISYHNRQVAHREIDHIFQDLFPSHGMTARPIQIELSHKMLDGPGRHAMAWEEVLKDMVDLTMCDLPVMITNHL